MRVIALNSFIDEETGERHPYGHEFNQAEGAKLNGWLATKKVRKDDRVEPAMHEMTDEGDEG